MSNAAAAANLITLSIDDWEVQYKPLDNHLKPGEGYRFETYGADFEFVKSQPQEKVWTIVDEDGHLWVTNGYRVVNAFSYVVTEVAFDPTSYIEVDYEG